MRRSAFILFLAGSVIFGTVFAQEQHQKKVFIDKVQKKLYWPVGKQFFFKLAEAASPDAPAYLVGSADSSRGYNVFLSGLHSFRWIEELNHDTSIIHFTADGEKPKCRVSQKGTRYVMNGKNYYGKGFALIFSSTDKFSGVENVYASIDSAKFTAINDTLTFDKEKEYLIRFYAVDRVGNVGNVSSVSFSMDLTPPVTTLTANNNAFKTNDVFSGIQSLKLSAADAMSGVKETWYCFDQNEKYMKVNGNVSLSSLKDGNHTISYYSVDNVGVAETVKIASFFVDNTVPVVQIEFDGDHITSKSMEFVSAKTTIRLIATDNKSGVETIEYAFGKSNFAPYTAPLAVPQQGGKITLGVKAIDKKGNMAPVKIYTLQIDSKAPSTKVEISGPMYKNSNMAHISSVSRISLSAADELSGVKAIRYSAGSDTEVVYTEPFSLKNEGRIVINYRSTDNVNNKEDSMATVVFVDTASPKIIETFSDANAGNTGKQSVMKIQRNSSLYLAASDNASGVNVLSYTFDGKKEMNYLSPLVFDVKGNYSLTIKCKDNVGNRTEKKLTIEVSE